VSGLRTLRWAIIGICRSNVWTCSRAQGKNRRLMANFAHAKPRPLWTDCNQILHVGLGWRCDHWCQVLCKSVKGFRSYRTPKRHFLYLTFIALTTVSALPCCTVINSNLGPISLFLTYGKLLVENFCPILPLFNPKLETVYLALDRWSFGC